MAKTMQLTAPPATLEALGKQAERLKGASATATLAFLDEVRQIAGVQVAETGDSLAGETILVCVASLWGPEADQVYELQAQVLRAHPEAHLQIQVCEFQDLGAGNSWPSRLPAGLSAAP